MVYIKFQPMEISNEIINQIKNENFLTFIFLIFNIIIQSSKKVKNIL